MATADVVVVGGGIAGASAAAELACIARVVLVEREAQPGYHSTGRSAALFSETYGNAAIRALTRASRPFFEAWGEGFAEHPILTPRGALVVALPGQDAALDEAWGELSRLDPTIRRLDPSEARGLVPVLRPDAVAGAIHEPGAMDIDVHALHQGYLRLFRRRGGTVMTDAPVHELSRNGGWTVRTPAGDVEAAVVVDAAGAWADEVAGLAGVPPIGLVPKRRTAAIVPAPAGIDARAWPLTVDVGETGYFKPESGRLLVSPADETPVPPCDVQPDDIDVALAIERLTRLAAIEVRRVERKWAGLRSFVADKTPVVGFDQLAPGFFWLAGQGGYGIQTAEGIARLATALIAGAPSPADPVALGLDPVQLSPARFLR